MVSVVSDKVVPEHKPAESGAAASQLAYGSQRMASPTGVNVGRAERGVSVVAGGALALYGLTRRSWPGLALAVAGGELAYRGVSGHCAAYQALGVSTTGKRISQGRIPNVEGVITVSRPPEELYRYWRNFENLPHFMEHLVSVKTFDDKRSHWVVKAPLGRTVEWDAEVVDGRPNEFIAWRSLAGADVANAGSVHFTRLPAERGTLVKVSLEYSPPGNVAGATMAKLFGEEPSKQIKGDLRRFKQTMEAGEMPTTSGQSSGRGMKLHNFFMPRRAPRGEEHGAS